MSSCQKPVDMLCKIIHVLALGIVQPVKHTCISVEMLNLEKCEIAMAMSAKCSAFITNPDEFHT